ncbi:MAG: type II toxin-antitoxin system VapC family toxin [Egibacteraceae bacterium]
MRYWDASALVPIVVREPHTEAVRTWATKDPAIVTWAWSGVEIISAVERRAREGALTRSQRRLVLARFAALAAAWDEVSDVLAVRARAIPLLARHPLRAADAAQLAAASLVNEHLDAPLRFVCLDARLADAAEREGLVVMPEPDGDAST